MCWVGGSLSPLHPQLLPASPNVALIAGWARECSEQPLSACPPKEVSIWQTRLLSVCPAVSEDESLELKFPKHCGVERPFLSGVSSGPSCWGKRLLCSISSRQELAFCV